MNFWIVDLCREVRLTSWCGVENSLDLGVKIAWVLGRSGVANLVI